MSTRGLKTGLLLAVLVLPAMRVDAATRIYAFVDEDGVRHYTDVPNDDRYRLIIDPVHDRTASGQRYDPRMLSRASVYDPIIERVAAAQALEPNLLRAVIVVESGFNARAVSPRGAVGLMQLMPATARRFGASNLYDPGQNLVAGAGYLKFLMDRFGNDLRLALAAYNAGEDAVFRSGGRIPPFAETQAYVPRVLDIYHRLRAQARPS